jgi:hypothetical protein
MMRKTNEGTKPRIRKESVRMGLFCFRGDHPGSKSQMAGNSDACWLSQGAVAARRLEG